MYSQSTDGDNQWELTPQKTELTPLKTIEMPVFEVDQTSDYNLSEVKKSIEMPVFKVNHQRESKVSKVQENLSQIICNISKDFPTQVLLALSEYCEKDLEPAQLHEAILTAESILIERGQKALTKMFSTQTLPMLDDLN